MIFSISICGSMAFADQMESMAGYLRALGCEALTPAKEESGQDWLDFSDTSLIALKKSYIDRHLTKIRRSHAVLIANFRKHETDGYLGPNTLMEAAFAYTLSIPVLFLYDPSQQPCGLECLAISSGVLDGEPTKALSLLKQIRSKEL